MNSQELENLLRSALAEILAVNPATLDSSIAFDRYGLDSAAVVYVSGRLGESLGREIDPVLFYEYPTISLLAGKLATDSPAPVLSPAEALV